MRFLIILGSFVLALCATAALHFFDKDLNEHAQLGRMKIYSDTIDLTTEGEIKWKVPREQWGQVFERGEADLSLVLSREGIPVKHLQDSSRILRVRVRAMASNDQGVEHDRLVRNQYFTTDEPLNPDARIWSVWGADRIELGLARITVEKNESILITLNLLVPDKELGSDNARLKIVPNHDFAVYGHLTTVRHLRNTAILVSLVLLLTLLFLAARRVKVKPPVKT